jgi:hypothetical protein
LGVELNEWTDGDNTRISRPVSSYRSGVRIFVSNVIKEANEHTRNTSMKEFDFSGVDVALKPVYPSICKNHERTQMK